MTLPGMLAAAVVRSPHPHARLIALDVERAAHLPGVVRILTAVDVPGANGFESYSRQEPVADAGRRHGTHDRRADRTRGRRKHASRRKPPHKRS